jgi:hypothetical protein
MINNNLNINLNSMVPLNSINYKSNQHRESFPYELDKIHPKMLQRDGVVMTVMKVLVMMMMMIPMKPSSMAVMMAMISPLQGGISPVDFYLPKSFLSVCVFRPAEAAESICDPPGLRFSGRRYTRRGGTKGGPGRPHHLVARPSGYFRLPAKYEFLGIFLELLVFRNMVS